VIDCLRSGDVLLGTSVPFHEPMLDGVQCVSRKQGQCVVEISARQVNFEFARGTVVFQE